MNYSLNQTLVDQLKHLKFEPLRGGRNSKVFLVHDTVHKYIFKVYSERDSARERLAREFQFLQYCKESGIGQVPELIASDPIQNVIVLSHIPGEPTISPSMKDFQSCAQFFLRLNSDSLKGKIYLRHAIERIFNGTSMIEAVENRIFSTQKSMQGIDLTANMQFVKELNVSFLEYLSRASTQALHEYKEFENLFLKRKWFRPPTLVFTILCHILESSIFLILSILDLILQ